MEKKFQNFPEDALENPLPILNKARNPHIYRNSPPEKERPRESHRETGWAPEREYTLRKLTQPEKLSKVTDS